MEKSGQLLRADGLLLRDAEPRSGSDADVEDGDSLQQLQFQTQIRLRQLTIGNENRHSVGVAAAARHKFGSYGAQRRRHVTTTCRAVNIIIIEIFNIKCKEYNAVTDYNLITTLCCNRSERNDL